MQIANGFNRCAVTGGSFSIGQRTNGVAESTTPQQNSLGNLLVVTVGCRRSENPAGRIVIPAQTAAIQGVASLGSPMKNSFLPPKSCVCPFSGL